MGRPKKLVVQKYLTDKEVSDLEGTWIDESFLKHPVIRENTDVYYKDEEGKEHLLLKFRKDCISNALVKTGWDSYKDLAKPSRGRGASAGPIDIKSQYWSKRSLTETSKWSTSYMIKDGTKKSKMKVNNQVASNPIGFYEESKNFCKLPCRLTHFTRTNYDKYKGGLPFIQRIDQMFQKLIPNAYEKQLNQANKKPHLKIPDTCFSTITINRNFRTALHRDAGDYKEGFGNLTVIERGKYHGGYTVFPQFGVGVDVRANDFVAMDVHQWHSNTPIYETEEDKKFNANLEPAFKDNPEVGTVGIYEKYTRLTFVCYLREKIVNCPDEIPEEYLKASGHGKIVLKETEV
tara:strand:+ start:2708 stop:3748 length:1041 start_codon:yes stop_codon:yes gene_type:complete